MSTFSNSVGVGQVGVVCYGESCSTFWQHGYYLPFYGKRLKNGQKRLVFYGDLGVRVGEYMEYRFEIMSYFQNKRISV